MKSRKLILPCFILLTGLSGLLHGCKKIEDGLSSIIWQINFDLVTTTWDIQYLDAATNLPIGANTDDRIEVTLSGTDARNIIDLAGVRQPIFYSNNGFMALALHPDRLTPQALTPVRFVIHARHASYIPVEVPVLAYREGINPIRIYMIKRNSSPVNVDLLNQTAGGRLEGGKLVDSLRLSTPANRASFKMSSGTEILTSANAQLVGSPAITFSHWEGGTTGGLKVFPGGQVSVNSAGNPGLVHLACGMYLEIIDRDSRLAGKFSKPVQFTANVNRLAYNPNTRQKLTAGETVPVWLLNQDTGVWESKGTTILQNDQDQLVATIGLNSPGLILIGWIRENLCPSPLKLHPGTLPEYNEIPYSFSVNIFEFYEEELRFIRTAEISGQVTQDCDLRFLPDNSELVLRFEAYTGEDKPYYRNPDPILLSGFCQSGNPAEFDLLPKPGSTFKKIEVVFIDVEHNRTRYNPKVFPGYYRKNGATTWQSAFVYEGQSYMVNPQEGSLYQMGVNYKGKLHMKEVTIGPEDVVLVEIEID